MKNDWTKISAAGCSSAGPSSVPRRNVPPRTQAIPAGAAGHTRAAGPFFNSVWGVDDQNLFVVGTDGAKYYCRLGEWIRTQNNPGRDYAQVWGTKVDDVYAVGVISGSGKGIIEHFDGDTWRDEYIAPTPIYSVWGDGTIVLAVGPGGHIYGKEARTTEWAERGRLTEPDVPDFVAVTGNGKTASFTATSIN